VSPRPPAADKDNPVFATAMRLVKMGISVIPIAAGTKEPPEGFKWGVYGHRLPDNGELYDWFIVKGYTGLAVVPGTTAPWLNILDFDGPLGYASFARRYPAAVRWTRVKTGSGKFHLWFRSPPGVVAAYAKFAAPDGSKAELRNGMHYTVIPPSIHPDGGEYAWEIPPWESLVEADHLTHGIPVKTQGPEDALPFVDGDPLTQQDIDRVRAALAPSWVDGQRHDLTLAVAGWLASYKVPESDVWAIVLPLVTELGGDRRDIRNCVRSTYKRASEGVAVSGWSKLTDSTSPLVNAADALTLDGLLRSRRPKFTLSIVPPVSTNVYDLLVAKREPRPHPFVIHARALLEEPDEGDSMLIDGLLRAGVVSWLAGPPRVYKSFIMMEMAVSLAAGVAALGGTFHVERPRVVVYLQEEGSRRDVRRRLRAIIRGKGLLPANVEPNLLIITNEHWRLDDDEQVNKLVNEVVIPYQPAAIFADPYRNLHHTNENDAGEQMQLMERLLFLRDEFGTSYNVVHHFGKENLVGKTPREGDELRGSSVLWAATAGGILVYPTSAEQTVRLVLHHKEGTGRREVMLKLDFKPDVHDDGGEVAFTVFESPESKAVSPDVILEAVIDLHTTLPGGWPTAKQIAAATGLAERTAVNKVNTLIEAHLVETQGHHREKRRYAPTADAMEQRQPQPAQDEMFTTPDVNGRAWATDMRGDD
jgi:hypothetical protein